jgi:hypothetical protein
MEVTSPAIQHGVGPEWAEPLVLLLVETAPLLGAYYGVVRYEPVLTHRDPLRYSHHFYGPPRDPDDLPGAQWVSLLAPRVVERLGGPDRIATDAPVHRLDRVEYLDGRVGCVAQVTADARDFPGDRADAWRTYLDPVLTRP